MDPPHGFYSVNWALLQMRLEASIYEEYDGYQLNPAEKLVTKSFGRQQSLVVERLCPVGGHS